MSHEWQRLRLEVTGAVQGVGFRPFVHRLAVSEALGGFVHNTGEGVSLEIEGPTDALDRFLARLDGEMMLPASIHARQIRRVPARDERAFVIAPSVHTTQRSAVVLSDLATCSDCLREILNPADRRHLYPFTTCVHCGPRYSIIEAVPYDRTRTTMRHFPMCAACHAEYDDASSRRFHAETNACPDCGPQLALWDPAGRILATRHDALMGAADALRQGLTVALKGLGGFQLLVDARNGPAVTRLRERKRRPAKPFAIMVPCLADALEVANLAAEEQRLLCSAAAPIVLMQSRCNRALVAESVAPTNPWLGVMLPYTPLHHLLMSEIGFSVVATSGNRCDEPIVADEAEALERLGGIADRFVVHDRAILRPVDDSVVRVVAGRRAILRLARGYAPLVLPRPTLAAPALALGGHQKDAVAVAVGKQIILGPHIGDLDSAETRTALARAVERTTALYDIHPQLIACDEHPDYYSTRFADRLGPQVQRVPHHLAHALAAMVDNSLGTPVLAVTWDGTGYGGDGTIWGGEFLRLDETRYRRVAHLEPFRLPGGATAMREPRRAALGALYAMFGGAALTMMELCPVADFAPAERRVLARMLDRGVNSPLTSSAGRLFDAIAAILGLRQKTSFEGEAAIAVEVAADRSTSSVPLAAPCLSARAGRLVIDWRPILTAMVTATREGIAAEDLAAAFHDALADAICAVATRVGTRQVLLTGGCFQNARLTERAIARLRAAGFEPYWHHRVPSNDGGLAAGQAVFLARPLNEERT
jgi:hydrogenase maturation protein HypF